jgi:carbonic anhydrase
MNHGSFATAINCMDGRTQIPVINYVREKYGVDYVDMITEPGPIRVLAENRDKAALESIKRRVEISTGKHGSEHIVIIGHHDCAGNPVQKETQLKQILGSIKTVQSWVSKVEIIGLWVDEKWAVYEIK